jgi:hypothetical protein
VEFNTFVRKPFLVEAVEVTEENIEEIAALVGVLKKKDDGTPFIKVNKLLYSNIHRIYPGFWMTKMGDNIRFYYKHVFNKQFMQIHPELDEWFRSMDGYVEVDEPVGS